MNIQQLLNVFGNFIDECAQSHSLISSHKDEILDRCNNLYENWYGLYFSNSEILGKGMPKPLFQNYFGVKSKDESAPRSFYAFVTLRYSKKENKALTLEDFAKALKAAKKFSTEQIPFSFYNNKDCHLMSEVEFTEDGAIQLQGKTITDADLQGRLSICCNPTGDEQELKKQLAALMPVFLAFNNDDKNLNTL
ncbi:hypothetical protein [uncultured Fibrobacter sp.]|uniref:hypothetical protein n=1 Tax=uncultured Fibrobacter sp. TaxID=261512 RepID=UPI002804DF9E|nr:hypothetical protein [uncultured Fibrobacter sp.]